MRKKAIMLTLVLLTLIFSISSCTTVKKNNSQSSKNVSTEANNFFDKLDKKDRANISDASPAQLVRIFYESVNTKKYDMALACLSESFFRPYQNAPDNSKIFLQYLKGIKSVNAISIKEYQQLDSTGNPIPNTNELARFDVLINLVPVDAKKIDLSGRQEKFITVIKQSGRWYLSSFATCP